MKDPSINNIFSTNDFLFKKRVIMNEKNNAKIIEYDIYDNELKINLLSAKCSILEGKVEFIQMYKPLSQDILAFIYRSPDISTQYSIVVNNNDVGYIKYNNYSWEYYSVEKSLYACVKLKRESYFAEDLFMFFLTSNSHSHPKDSIFEFYKSNIDNSTPVILGKYFGFIANLDMTLDRESYLDPYICLLLGLICDIYITHSEL